MLSVATARPSEKKVRLMVYLPRELENTLRYAMFIERSNTSAIVEQALTEYFKTHKIEAPFTADEIEAAGRGGRPRTKKER
jgi:hypothetical protein